MKKKTKESFLNYHPKWRNSIVVKILILFARMEIQAQQLMQEYVNPGLPGSFSGFGTFSRALKSRGIALKEKELKKWMQSQTTYTVHRPKRKHFPRNKVIVAGIDDTWQADLVDMKSLAQVNNSSKYILTIIDVFSKHAWAVPLKNKFGKTVAEAFSKLFQKGRKPRHIQTDDGSEFFNEPCRACFRTNDVKLYSVKSELKACVVERFNRTLKEKMWRYFTAKGAYRYIDVLDKFIDSYNNTYHRSIRMTPNGVCRENEEAVWNRLYHPKTNAPVKFRYNIGDKVRLSKNKPIFEKGYTPNWTEEIFIITERIPKFPPVYHVKDLNNTIIKGTFYEFELQQIIHDDTFRVDQIFQKRYNRRLGCEESFVSFLGYPEEFNCWVRSADIFNVAI